MDLYKVRKELNLGISLSKMHLRVTDYSRVSTDHIEQQNSLKNQIEHFDEMIKNNPNWIYIKGYVDDGISGTTDYKRDNFMRMIDDARVGKFDLIITKEISRFSRNTLDSIKYTRELLDYGVAVLFVNDNINTALPDAELRLTIMASMAQDEIRRLSERVKFGMARSIKNGIILGNDMLYGYKKNKKTGDLEIVDEEAIVVKRIFNMYIDESYSLSKIAKILNSEKIKTCQNKKWSTTTLSRMIKNPKYKGYYCGKKTEIVNYMTKKVKMLDENDWIIYEDKKRIPPIIDDRLWCMANKRLKTRSLKFGNDYKNNKIIYQNRYSLSAKIYCANDNEVFHRRKQLKSSDDISWICSKHLREGVNKCNSPILRESEIYNILKDVFDNLKIELSNVTNILLKLYEDDIKEDTSIDNLNILNKQKEKLLLKKERILNLNIESNLSDDEFCRLNNECNNKIKEIDNEINKLKIEEKKFIKTPEMVEHIKKTMNELLNTKDIIDKLLELLLEKIVVDKYDINQIKLSIYISFGKAFKYSKIFENKVYEFKRGYNTTSTKRYIINYFVTLYVTT